MEAYFKFNGNTSLNILPNTKLMIRHMENDYSTSVPIFSRDIIKTDFSQQQDYRRITGSKYNDGFSLKFVLIKDDETDFTFNDINTISNWLYGDGASQKFEVICDETSEESYYYIGIFVQIERIRVSGTVGIQCVFETNSPYLYVNRSVTVDVKKNAIMTYKDINVQSQNFVYPKIKLKPKNISDRNMVHIQCEQLENGNYRINNSNFWIDSDSDKKVITVDTKNAIISNDNSGGIENFSVLGWDDVSKISWLKLWKGNNKLGFSINNNNDSDTTSSCNITVSWEDKILGGVLNEFSV